MYSFFKEAKDDKNYCTNFFPIETKKYLFIYGYECLEDETFYYFHNSDLDTLTLEQKKQINTGWKAHVTVETSKIKDAFLILAPILMQYNVPSFKMIKKNQFEKYKKMTMNQILDLNEKINTAHSNNAIFDNWYFYHEKESAKKTLKSIKRLLSGMQFTIYIVQGEEHFLQTILEHIEHALDESRISTGKIHSSDRALGKYVSVRHTGTTEYLPYHVAKSSNPENASDPFKNIIITHQDITLPPPIWFKLR